MFCAQELFFLTSSSHIVVFAAFAIAASAIHLCVSATVSVWFSAPLQDKRFIFATFGRGAVKLVLLPVVGLSLVSLSISDVYVSIFKFAAAPFAILYALGSLTHFHWAVIDFQSIFSQRISEPRQVAPPQRRHGRRNPVEEEVQPANNMQAIETVETIWLHQKSASLSRTAQYVLRQCNLRKMAAVTAVIQTQHRKQFIFLVATGCMNRAAWMWSSWDSSILNAPCAGLHFSRKMSAGSFSCDPVTCCHCHRINLSIFKILQPLQK